MTLTCPIQFIALQNIQLLLSWIPGLFDAHYKIFFCKFNDPIYIKLAKLDVLVSLANNENLNELLDEFKELSLLHLGTRPDCP